MVAYKKISLRDTEADFLQIKSRELVRSKNQKLVSAYFFPGQNSY